MKLKGLLIYACFFAGSLAAQNTSILFEVNMSYQIQTGNFDPQVDFVDIAGTFNGWGADLSPLADLDGDSIYSLQLSGFVAGSTIEFKFRQNGLWDGTEEFPGAGNNRVYEVQADANELYYWYNDELPPNGPPLAAIISDNQSAYEQALLNFRDESGGLVETREWWFEGGEPTTSTAVDPEVRYETAGLYDVQLIVSNSFGSDTSLLEDYIEIKPRDLNDTYWWNETTFYEIFVRSFYDSDGDGIGDFQGIIEKLDYLNDGDPNTHDDLGITGIWLMPIHDSPSYHGYDVVDYRSINPDYGTMEDFQEFLDAAHARGIKVIIDYVMNHSSTQHPWFQDAVSGPNAEKRDWFRWSDTNPGYSGPWGQQVWHNSNSGYYYGIFWSGMPDLNYEQPALQAEMFETADFWLEEIGVDGFRLDAVKFIYEDGQLLEDLDATLQFWQDFRAHYKQTNPEAFTVGEAWTNTDKVLTYVEEERLDYCFEFDLASAILWTIQNNDPADWLRYQAQKTYNVYPHGQFGTFLTNHDQDRVMSVYNNSQAKVKAAAATYLTLPGVPYLYYGEEIGMTGTKPDPNIRRPMQWDDSIHAGFTTGNPWHGINSNYTTYNVADAQADANSLFHWYRRLIRLRNVEPAFRTGSYEPIHSNEANLFSFLREKDGEQFLVMVNTGGQALSDITLDFPFVDLPLGTYGLVEQMNIQQSVNVEVVNPGQITGLDLEPYGVRIYRIGDAISNVREVQDEAIRVFPNPSQSSFEVQLAAPPAATIPFQVLDMQGREIRTGNWGQGQLRQVIDLSAYPAGTYFLRVTGMEQHGLIRLMKL